MSSSISGSDAFPGREMPAAWRRWIRLFCITFVIGISMLYLLVVAVDPFSTGRFSILQGVDIAAYDMAFGNAGRVRDSRFDFAVVGNSHAVAFAPERLDAATGRRFVLLTVTGSGPNEQIATARAFARHHRGEPVGMLWVLDFFWCLPEGDAGSIAYPNFPYWLYESGDVEYLRNIFSWLAVQSTVNRLGVRLLNVPPLRRPDGYSPAGNRLPPDRLARALAASRPDGDPAPGGPFASADRVASLVADLEPQVSLILTFLPNYVTFLPEPGSPAERRLAACKERFRAIAAGRPRTIFIDHMVEDDTARNPANFMDSTHATDALIRRLEPEFASAVRELVQAKVQ